MATDVLPDRQNLDGVFSNTYYKIDFYQREYKWEEEQVGTLLDDLFHIFGPEYKNFRSREPTEKTIEEFRWYYLSTYVTNNEENLQIFNGDEEEFERERHRLGALLLLNNRDNLSSGNEIFEKKKDTYATTLYWNQSLREDFTKSKPNHQDFLDRINLDLAVDKQFDKRALENRTRALCQIAREIWVK